MEAAKNYMVNEFGATKIKVSAQSYLQRFYENLGFEIVTEMYLEDGIPHFGMLCKV
jgi:ElaA protein